MKIQLLGSTEIQKMREAGKAAADLLAYLGSHVRPGISTAHLDDLGASWANERDYLHAPKGYKGYPRHICTSINDVVTHGIPSAQDVLAEGDIVNIDVTPIVGGYCGDTSKTFIVEDAGHASKPARVVVETSHLCLEAAIAVCKPGAHLGDIGAAILKVAEQNGCSVVREFTGHFIGRAMHIDPPIPHWGIAGTGFMLEPGMVFTVEPMVNYGGADVKAESDGWTVKTKDGSLSAQCEHTVAITETGAEVLTRNEKLRF